MKKLLFFLVLLLMTQIGLSQVGINTTLPNAQLDIRSSNQVTPSNTDGILIPKIDAFPLTNPTAAQQGMMVYLTTLSGGRPPGFYYWNNATATWLGLGGSAGWALTGNSGTNPATNFIGTTDATDVVFRRDNVISGKIGMANTSFGRNSMNPLSSGIYNSAYGLNSMSSNTSGNSNSAFGNYALNNNTSGNANTAFGSNVMYTNTTGQQNTAFGSDALEYNTTGNNNSATGYFSLYNNSIGNNNTAHGFETLRSNQTGGFNTAIGSRALQASVTGAVNTAIGDDALSKSNGADLNVAVGGSSMLENLTGSSNTAVGSGSLRNNVAASRNTAIGYEALYSNTGSENTALGYHSNILGTTGSRNITIGANANVNDPAGNDQLSIANVIYGSDLNSTATGKIGIGVPVPTEKLEVDGKTKTTNLQVTNGAGAGLVLTSDAIGNATWQTAAAGNSWSTTGNSGLNAATNFIGTTDNSDVVFKRSNSKAGLLGGYITGFGVSSMNNATTGTGNTAFGAFSMFRNTTGSYNVALGSDALSRTIEGSNGTSIGYASMFYFGGPNTAFTNTNTAVGYRSMLGEHFGSLPGTNNTGMRNTAIGYEVLQGISSGYDNTANGYLSLYTNTTGSLNTALGSNSLFSNTTGSFNVATGSFSLYSNTTGLNNTAIGDSALYSNTTSSSNTAVGTNSLRTNSSGSDNIALGYNALFSNSSGGSNTATGSNVLFSNTTGGFNTATGVAALYLNTTGFSNTSIGNSSLRFNTTGARNVALGGSSLNLNTDGSNNTALGYQAGYSLLGSANIVIGYQAGYNETGSNKLYIDNSNSTTPLIYGEFDTDLIRINGRAEGLYTQLTANGDGQSSIYGYRTRDSQNDGVNYSRAGTNKAINGYNFWGDVYTFGVAGHSFNDYSRTGGVLGADVNGIYWASLGYRNSGVVNYGVYATAALATGAGRLSQPENAFSIGGGFYGDMIGSWSRGTMIGQVSSGTLFASYNSGDEYTSGKQIELVDTGATKTAAYTVTSTESVIYKKGKITLQKGTAYVSFDANYINLLGDVPVVTASPMGQCNGLYIESVDKNGFTIKELNNGTSNVSVSWISVGDRIDAHSNAISPSVLDRNFDANMNDVMFNENNTTQQAKAIWTEGKTIQFGQLPEKLIEKPTKEVELK